jgi:hypothetical protein
MRSRWSELEIHRAESVWGSRQQTFLAQVVGPHFEALCREFALDTGAEFFGDHPAEVGSATVNDPASRTQIEIDVVVLAPHEPNSPQRILCLGEAKWGEVIGRHHLERLIKARELLKLKGYVTDHTTLACFGGAGFTKELTAAAAEDSRIVLVGLDHLYRSPTV